MQDQDIEVQFFNDSRFIEMALIKNDTMIVNLGHFNLSPGLMMGENEISLMLHEITH